MSKGKGTRKRKSKATESLQKFWMKSNEDSLFLQKKTETKLNYVFV